MKEVILRFKSMIRDVEALTDSPTPRQYWGKIKDRKFKARKFVPNLGTTEINVARWQEVRH